MPLIKTSCLESDYVIKTHVWIVSCVAHCMCIMMITRVMMVNVYNRLSLVTVPDHP